MVVRISGTAIELIVPAAYSDPRVGITANSESFFTCMTSEIFLNDMASVGLAASDDIKNTSRRKLRISSRLWNDRGDAR